MKSHPDFARVRELFPAIRLYQELADRHGIDDIFQDNGGKYLYLLLLLGLRVLPGREGNDAIDENGNEVEIKTVNLLKTTQFSTHHHMNPRLIEKYRQVDWYFVTFEAIELLEVYKLTPEQMEPQYQKWERKWYSDGKKDINNPKIPLAYVKEMGTRVLPERQIDFNLLKR